MAKRQHPLQHLLLLAVGWPVLCAGSASAAQEPVPSFWERDALFGDLAGARPWLADSGVEVELSLLVDATRGIDGGAERKSAVRGFFDVAVSVDLDSAAGIEGATLFLDAYSIFGEQDPGVGSVQGVSNLDADVRDQIAELWWEQLFLDERLRVKVGKVEANSEFAWVEYGGDLIAPPWAISPNVLAIPTYPETAPSINLEWTPDDASWVRFGVYDGAAQSGRRTGVHGLGTTFGEPSDLWIALEAGRTWSDGRVGIGAWRATGDFDRFSGGVEDGTDGFYVVFDQALTTSVAEDGETLTGAGLFARVSYADPDVSEVHVHFATGLHWQGLVDSLPNDALGCGVSWCELSDDAGFSDDREVLLEVFWRHQLTPAISVQPDLQFVLSPGGDETIDDAILAGLRLAASF
jgi:porin